MTDEELSESDRRAIEDMEWWRKVAEAMDCKLYGYSYRHSASIYHPHPAYFELIDIPGWFGEKILDLKKQAERE